VSLDSPGIDPTRIDMAVDPQRQRLVGVSAHGLKAFDVPFISEIVPDLWLGGCEDGLVLPAFIEHLVSLYPWEQYTVRHELGSSLQVRMYDSVDQAFHQVDSIAAWVNGCRAEPFEPGRRPGVGPRRYGTFGRDRPDPPEAVSGVPVQSVLRTVAAGQVTGADAQRSVQTASVPGGGAAGASSPARGATGTGLGCG
jgi:hypothetical protein